MDIKVLYEDPHIIVVEKPPKVPSQQDKTGDTDLMSLVKDHLKEKYPAARNPYLGLIHRLDRPVGGLMVFAKTKEANAKLSEQMKAHSFKKEYLAVVCGKPDKEHEEIRDYLLKNQARNVSKVVPEGVKGAKEAILEYTYINSVLAEETVLSLLKIKLKTGRHHQIRVQLANKQLPLWGDHKYNPIFVKKKEWTQLALWAWRLTFNHPKTGQLCSFESNPTEYPFNLFNI
ncbi:RluA family pseudouridine synthase [Defluviitalea raffinosedens]|uniref:RluA family pseudouridine synthase n=1 Tax=Defluviitalea raffinosedens TaxID=1450156 RepID=UPI0019585013|nr:RluA family pseudouridine synthase [Defluviitalea raffinosedens]MBM7684765.1 23S rRNA pseudouridine1911/1915/1917 synthase [Defluviitalea raffinosedens]